MHYVCARKSIPLKICSFHKTALWCYRIVHVFTNEHYSIWLIVWFIRFQLRYVEHVYIFVSCGFNCIQQLHEMVINVECIAFYMLWYFTFLSNEKKKRWWAWDEKFSPHHHKILLTWYFVEQIINRFAYT